MKSVPYGIIVQGPIVETTVEILNRYAKSCPRSKIILSTWDCEFIDVKLSKLDNNVSVVINEPPKICGSGNRNRQRLSTWMGLLRCKLYDTEYVLKTRTDHIFASLSDTFLDNLYQTQKQYDNDRIIVGNVGTTAEDKWGKFHISDFFQFGHFQDILNYWNLHNPFFKINEQKSLNTAASVEAEVAQLYMLEFGIKAESTLELLTKKFIVLDNTALDYHIFKQYPFEPTNWINRIDPKCIDFKQWRNAYDKRT